MDGNQNSNPLDYSQSGVVYKDLNGNGTAASNIKSNEFVDQNGIKSPSAPLGQVKIYSACLAPFFLTVTPMFNGTSTNGRKKNPKLLSHDKNKNMDENRSCNTLLLLLSLSLFFVDII